MVNAYKLTHYEYVVKAEFCKPCGKFEINRFLSCRDACNKIMEYQIRPDVLSIDFHTYLGQEREMDLFNS